MSAYAAEQEQRLKSYLPSRLHDEIKDAVVLRRGHREFKEVPELAFAIAPGRLLVTVESISYGSMKVDLGIPDIDAFIEVLGNNSEAFEALFGAYFPGALNRAMSWDAYEYEYEVSIPRELEKYIDSPRTGKAPQSESTAKEKGTALLIKLIQSPLILPIILICFLWFYARQDMIEERRVTYGLIQTLITEQTAVISLLKDKEKETTASTIKSTENASTQSDGKVVVKSGAKKDGK